MPRGQRNPAPEGDQSPENTPEGEAPAGETKAQKFVRLGSARMSNALKQIQGIGKLSGSGYESTPEQRAKMFGTLRKAVDDAEAQFKPREKGGKPEFTF